MNKNMPQSALVLLSGMLLGAPAWACSGPGARASIEASERLGWWLFGANGLMVVAGLVVLHLLGKPLTRTAWLLSFVAIHPGWWLSARGGDCGMMRSMGSWGALGLTGLVLSVLFLFARIKKSKTAG